MKKTKKQTSIPQYPGPYVNEVRALSDEKVLAELSRLNVEPRRFHYENEDDDLFCLAYGQKPLGDEDVYTKAEVKALRKEVRIWHAGCLKDQLLSNYIKEWIVVPEELTNIIVLDASYPIRKLCLLDDTVRNAETLPSVKQTGIKSFHSLKQFDNVTLYRLRSFGGRHSMEQRFKDRSMVKEVVEVLKTIPENEAVLFYLYKLNQTGTNYQLILEREISKAGIDLKALTPNGKPRIIITTWGNETSLNCYSHASNVFLVGILHRDDTDLMASYLAQTKDIRGEVNKAIANELQLSEKAHLAYQALSRGTCRNVSDGKALPMKGYIVEIDPEIETTLTKVMPGVQWEKWKPYFVPESEGIIETWATKVQTYLDGLPDTVSRISSQSLRKILKADKVAPFTWTKVIRSVTTKIHTGSKKSMGEYVCLVWSLEGRSLVRQTAEAFGFSKEVA